MDNSLKIVLESLENIKTKISDNEYKIMVEELQKIHSKQQNDVKKFSVHITYLDPLYLTTHTDCNRIKKKLSNEYEVYVSKKKLLILRDEYFKRFYEGDEKKIIFTSETLLDGLLPNLGNNIKKYMMYYTLSKEEI